MLLEILGYICYAILIFITIGWMLGVRYTHPVYPTILTSIYFVILSIAVPLAGINYLHLLWLIPLVYFMGLLNICIWAYEIPFVTKLLNFICNIYINILRIRIGKRR